MKFVFILFAFLSFAVSSSNYEISKAPDWVDHSKFEQASFNQYLTQEFYFKWREEQISNIGVQQSYQRRIVAINSLRALKEASHINIDFNPAFQKLKLHDISVVRDGKRFSQLNAQQIRLLSAEDDLAENVYTGNKRLNLLLEEVRVGDDIHIEYTVEGANPIFDGKLFKELPTQFVIFAESVYYSVMVNSNTNLNYKLHGFDAPTQDRDDGKIRKLSWAFSNRLPYLYDEHFPTEEIPHSWLQITEFNTWKEVNDWASNLFYSPHGEKSLYSLRSFDYTIAVKDWIKSINPKSRYVQDDELIYAIRNHLRYTSTSEGVYSHLAHDPIESLSRGYADCKDKVNIFLSYVNNTAVTRALPALVNSKIGKNLDEWLPSPNAFDHAILLVRDRNDVERWVDVTQTIKEQELENQISPDYGYALLLQSAENNLTPMYDEQLPLRHIQVVEEIDVSESKGLEGTIKLAVKFSSYGALEIRQNYYEGTLDLTKQLRNFYQQLYPGIRLLSSDIKLDERSPAVTITAEFKGVPNDFWQQQDNKKQIMVYPIQLNTMLTGYIDANRPISAKVNGPITYKHKATLTLPFIYGEEVPTTAIDNKFFSYQQTVKSMAKVLEFDIAYQGKVTQVKHQDIASYNEQLTVLSERMGVRYFIDSPPSKNDNNFSAAAAYANLAEKHKAPNLLLLIILLISIVSSVVAARKRLKNWRENTPELTSDIQYQGFMGSLFYVAIAIALYYLVALGSSILAVPLFFTSTWQALAGQVSVAFDPIWQLYIPVYAIGELTTLVLLTMAVFFFLRKLHASKKFLLLVVGAKFLISVTAYLLLQLIEKEVVIPEFIVKSPNLVVTHLVVFVFLILYFRMSKHVKNTLVKH